MAIDTETMGLNPHRDRLCLVQLSAGDGNAHLVQMPRGPDQAPRLAALLADPKVLKLFHFGRFDIAVLEHALGVRCEPVYCTKIAAKLVRTFTDRYGLKDLCRDLLGVDLSKQQQTSDWGAETLTDEQMTYAASDVLHLHALQGQARRHAGARGPDRAGPGGLPLPADPGPARHRRLAGRWTSSRTKRILSEFGMAFA